MKSLFLRKIDECSVFKECVFYLIFITNLVKMKKINGEETAPIVYNLVIGTALKLITASLTNEIIYSIGEERGIKIKIQPSKTSK